VQFSDIPLSSPILQAIRSEGYTIATPIQAQAIPLVLAGKDVLGCAQTGTGKTAAFATPILHRLSASGSGESTQRRPRCLVLCPTRELASQIAASFSTYGKSLKLRHTTVFGGVGQNPQVAALRRGVDIVVATPGRLIDLIQQRCVDLTGIETLVLDEADRMLDMGFIQPIRDIVARLPKNRQTLLFSATMAPEIRRLADSLLRDPAVIHLAPVASVTAKIDETVYRVQRQDKPELLAHLVRNLPMHRAIVFTRTKHGADRVVRHLHTRGIRAEAIHGNKSQNARQRALANFASDKIPVLVATDVASRGIDVDAITHVVNYDLTHEPETYIHRIGRTGRAGASGSAISFCDQEEVSNLRAIERLTRRPIPAMPNPLPASRGDISPIPHQSPTARPPQKHRHPHQHPHSARPRHPAASVHQAVRDLPHPPRAAAHGDSNSGRHQHKQRIGAGRPFHPLARQTSVRRHP
jgi:ATP-dependent RNA helicase RhlE